jgi:integrase
MRATRSAGLADVRLHDLRHPWATMQIKAGSNAATVSEALGHATVAFTLDTYTHPDDEMGRALADATEDKLGELL